MSLSAVFIIIIKYLLQSPGFHVDAFREQTDTSVNFASYFSQNRGTVQKWVCNVKQYFTLEEKFWTLQKFLFLVCLVTFSLHKASICSC